ncbi:PaaI family thioesterase [Brevibacterium litoralis]|uniref:PaaI family thioesterase n=1 Tax=Brevibacterium litoralis TaxID=3138935 RepID=UPI0032EF6B9C
MTTEHSAPATSTTTSATPKAGPLTREQLATMSGLEILRHMQAAAEAAAESGAELPPSIGRLLGMRVSRVDEGEVEFTLDTVPDFANPLGQTHGGICATLLDSALGCAVHTTLDAGVGYGTLEMKLNYVRSVPTDGTTLRAVGHVVHSGRSTAIAEGSVFDDQDRLVAHGTETCLIYR